MITVAQMVRVVCQGCEVGEWVRKLVKKVALYATLLCVAGLQQVVGAVVDTGLEGGEAFCVGRPQHDDLVRG